MADDRLLTVLDAFALALTPRGRRLAGEVQGVVTTARWLQGRKAR